MKAFDGKENHLYVAVYSKDGERFIGNVHASLLTLLAQHYNQQVSGSIQFEQQFAVKYFGENVGQIGLELKIKFSK